MIRGKPDMNAFLDGGNDPVPTPLAAKAAPVAVAAVVKAPKRIKKLFELPESMMEDLEQRCVDERRKLGRRVTQTEIVERSIGAYLYSKP